MVVAAAIVVEDVGPAAFAQVAALFALLAATFSAVLFFGDWKPDAAASQWLFSRSRSALRRLYCLRAALLSLTGDDWFLLAAASSFLRLAKEV